MFDLAFFRTVYYVEFTQKNNDYNDYLAALNARTGFNKTYVEMLRVEYLLRKSVGNGYILIEYYIIMRNLYFCH